MNTRDGYPIAVITGVTAVGKTEIAVELARRVGGEVISADSRQVYRGVGIGTGKPDGVWRDGRYLYREIPHHLVDFLDVREEYSAGRFSDDAARVVAEVRARGCTPLIVGGTGFYITAYADGLSPLPPRNPELRRQLLASARRDGPERLHELLAQRDPERAAQIHPRNTHRIIRALELVLETGMPVSTLLRRLPAPPRRAVVLVGLTASRERIRRRIAERVRRMFAAGIIEETASLLEQRIPHDSPGFTAIGYRHVIDHIRGTLSREEAMERTIRDTVRYARAQETWFRRDPRIVWFDAESAGAHTLVERVRVHFQTHGVPMEGGSR